MSTPCHHARDLSGQPVLLADGGLDSAERLRVLAVPYQPVEPALRTVWRPTHELTSVACPQLNWVGRFAADEGVQQRSSNTVASWSACSERNGSKHSRSPSSTAAWIQCPTGATGGTVESGRPRSVADRRQLRPVEDPLVALDAPGRVDLRSCSADRSARGIVVACVSAGGQWRDDDGTESAPDQLRPTRVSREQLPSSLGAGHEVVDKAGDRGRRDSERPGQLAHVEW